MLNKTYLLHIATSSLVLVLGLVTGSVSARLLGVEGRGLLAIVIFAGQFVSSISVLGMSDAVVSTTGTDSGSGILKRDVVVLAVANYLVVSCVFAIPIYFYLSPHGSEIAILGAAFFAAQLLYVVVTQLLFGALRARGLFQTFNAFRIGLPAVYAASMVSFVFLAPSVLTFVKLNILTVVILTCFEVFAIARFVDLSGRSRLVSRSAIFFYLINVLLIVSTQIDKLMVINFLSKQEVGIFIVATTVAGPFQGFLIQAMRTIAMPSLAKLDTTQKADMLQKGLATVWTISLVSSVFVSIAGPIVVLVAFGSEFYQAGILVPLITFSLALTPIRGLIIEALKTEPRKIVLYAIEAVYILTFSLSFTMLHSYGLVWSVIPSLFIGNLLGALVAIFCASRVYLISPFAWLAMDWDWLRTAYARLSGVERSP